MPTSTTVTVLVPAYNDGRFIGAALDSLAAQSFESFEVIVSDDASTDDTAEVVKAYAAADSRFKYFRNEKNLGMTANWNAALRRANGEYVMKLDADDVFMPQTLDRLVATMRSDARPFAAFCRTLTCDANLSVETSYFGERAFIKAGIEPLADHVKLGHEWYQYCFDDFQLWHSNAHILRLDTFVEMRGWDDAFGCASDTDFVLRVLEMNQPIAHVSYPGVRYRVRPDSVSARYRRATWLQWESTLLQLQSLSRMYARRARLSAHVRRQWWRIWNNYLKLRGEHLAKALADLRPDFRDRLQACAERVSSPPMSVCMLGRTRKVARALLPRR